MFDTIILLAGPVENTLASALRRHRPDLNVMLVPSQGELIRIAPSVLARARLIGFVTAVIVPRNVLESLGYGAYNFHPGPPRYPGWAPSHFALYDQATEFGATVHEMVEHVDAGPIVDVSSFPIPADTSVSALEGMAYARLALMFWNMSLTLATNESPLPTTGIQWGTKKNTRRTYQAICEIPIDIPKNELDRRIKIFGAHHFGFAPTINLHGVEFRAVPARHDLAAAASG